MVKQIITLLKIIIVSICIYFFYELTYENLNEIPNLNVSSPLYLTFLISLFTFNSLLLSFSWHIILQDSNIKSSYINNATFYHLTQFGKYFPGNFGQYISRAYYAKSLNISVFKMINFIILESYWLLCAAVLILFFIDFSLFFDNHLLAVLNKFSLKVILFLASIYSFYNLYRLIIIFTKKNFSSLNKIFNNQLSIENNFLILTSYFFYFVISALLLMLFINETLSYNNFTFFDFLGIVSFSWIIGFIIPGAPAGLGIREYSLVIMLSTIMPISIAISCSIIYRLLSLFSDVFLFTCSFIFKRCLKK